ncbi:MAG TPA: BatA domain-containing protein, partial [Gemmatimonadaceae bacterium]
MTFAYPWALLAAVGAALLVLALHFIARRRPRAVPFPTARFVPARSVRAPSRSTRPADLLLLLLRVLALLLLGAAFARPALKAERRPLARVVALDLSASGRSWSAARDSAARYLRTGDLLVVFDSAARLIPADGRDSLAALVGSHSPGSLSAALAAATRAATMLRDRADSVELVVVSPFASEEWDAATGAVRSLWRGAARLVVTERAGDSARSGSAAPTVVASPELDDDPVSVVAALMRDSAARADVRIVRGTPGTADSAWAREAGHVLVHWPASTPDEWQRRGTPDTVGAVVAGSAVLVADFARTSMPPAGSGRVVARWIDGAPAAIERAEGEGCVRDVAVSLSVRGDLVLRESARRFVRALAAPCGGARELAPLGESRLAVVRGVEQPDGARAPMLPERPESRASSLL